MNNKQNNKFYRLPMPLRVLIIKILLVAVVVVAVVLVARHYIYKVASTSTPVEVVKNDKIDITPSQIRSIEQIHRAPRILLRRRTCAHILWHVAFGHQYEGGS